MNAEERKKRLIELEEEKAVWVAEQDLKNIKSNAARSKSITIGTAFGGVTEISMRGDGGDFLWCILQPVEVTELIHQLAGNIGCHINIQPRRDFASWRDWKVTDEEKLRLNGHPPHPNDLLPHSQVGMTLPIENQPGMKVKEEKLKIDNDNDTLAIKKPDNKRKPRRTTRTTT